MSRNLVIGLVVIVVAIAAFLYYQETKDDVTIDLPGNNEIKIDK